MKLERVIASIIVVSIIMLFWLHYTNRISIAQWLSAEISLSLALIALLLPISSDTRLFSIRLPTSIWALTVVVYVIAEAEILIFKHTGLGYVVALGSALLIAALAGEKPAKKVAVAAAIVGASLIPLYTLYAPSFGNDTWRDIKWAAQALQWGHVTETTVRHSAYPIPMVQQEYALTSLLSGLDPVQTSVAVGLLYLPQLPLLTFLAPGGSALRCHRCYYLRPACLRDVVP